MTPYEKSKKELQDINIKLKQAKTDLAELEVKRDDLFESFESSYENLVDARAKLEIGEGKQADATEAEKVNKSLKSEIESVKDDISVKERTVQLLYEKQDQLQESFSKIASDHHRQQLKPMFEKLASAVKAGNEALGQINAQSKELQSDKHFPAGFLQGLTPQSEILINTKRVSGPDVRNFITQTKLENKQ